MYAQIDVLLKHLNYNKVNTRGEYNLHYSHMLFISYMTRRTYTQKTLIYLSWQVCRIFFFTTTHRIVNI